MRDLGHGDLRAALRAAAQQRHHGGVQRPAARGRQRVAHRVAHDRVREGEPARAPRPPRSGAGRGGPAPARRAPPRARGRRSARPSPRVNGRPSTAAASSARRLAAGIGSSRRSDDLAHAVGHGRRGGARAGPLGGRARELGDEEGVAARALVQVAHERVAQPGARGGRSAGPRRGRGRRARMRSNPRARPRSASTRGQLMSRLHPGLAVGEHEQHARRRRGAAHVPQQLERGAVGPVQVVEHDDEPAGSAARVEHAATASNMRTPVVLAARGLGAGSRPRPSAAARPSSAPAARFAACGTRSRRTATPGRERAAPPRSRGPRRRERAARRAPRPRPRTPAASCRCPARRDSATTRSPPAPARRAARPRPARARARGRRAARAAGPRPRAPAPRSPAERVAHLGRRGRALRGRLGEQRAAASASSARGRPRDQRDGGRGAARAMLGDHGVRRGRRERRPAAEQLVERRAERVEVGRRAGGAARRLLRRDVERRARSGRPRLVAPRRPTAMPKSPSAALPSAAEPDVVRLDVAMHDAVGVGVRERVGELARRRAAPPRPGAGARAPRRARSASEPPAM